ESESYHRELQIAAEIQQGILPHSFPPFPELVAQLDLYGLTRPAREMGGDYYDFFELSPNRIGLVVADVADKGLAPALFMAITHTLIRSVARRGLPPSEVLRRVNATLAAENPSSMFVTLIYGEYHPHCGGLAIANAGHNPPLVRRSNGEVEVLSAKAHLPLGAMPDSRYETLEATLQPGDGLLLYTDGITEAMAPSGEEWGINRFSRIYSELQGDSQTFSQAILDRIDAFCGTAEQHDDITLLLLQRRGSSGDSVPRRERGRKVHVEWPAHTGVLQEIAALIESMAQRSGLDKKETDRLSLAVDEVVTNVITHGAASASRFVMEITPLDRGIEVTVIDWGEPFDFDAKSRAYDGHATLEQPLGGIGLYVARRSVDEMRYYPGEADGNRLVLVKYRAHDAAGEPAADPPDDNG
ncbi:MAG: SpoIIE family protein phosphatase, partial [Pseudomonadota bacterium]